MFFSIVQFLCPPSAQFYQIRLSRYLSTLPESAFDRLEQTLNNQGEEDIETQKMRESMEQIIGLLETAKKIVNKIGGKILGD